MTTSVTTSSHEQQQDTAVTRENARLSPSKWKVLFFTWKLPTVIAAALFVGVAQLVSGTVPPSCRPVDSWDSTINHPFTQREQFPNYTLGFVVVLPVLAVYFPFIFVLSRFNCASTAIFPRGNTLARSLNNGGAVDGNGNDSLLLDTENTEISSGRRTLNFCFPVTTQSRAREFFTWTLAHFVAWALQQGIVDLTKILAGRLRPDFIDRLRSEGIVVGNHPPQWAPAYANHTAMMPDGNLNLCATEFIKNKVLREGRLSFPSGHSSNAWVAMTVLSLFLFSKLRPYYFQSFWRLLVSILPTALAVVIAVSRTLDYWHNFSDVMAGAIVGVAAAFVGVSLCFDFIKRHEMFVPKPPVDEHDALLLRLSSSSCEQHTITPSGQTAAENAVDSPANDERQNTMLSPALAGDATVTSLSGHFSLRIGENGNSATKRTQHQPCRSEQYVEEQRQHQWNAQRHQFVLDAHFISERHEAPSFY